MLQLSLIAGSGVRRDLSGMAGSGGRRRERQGQGDKAGLLPRKSFKIKRNEITWPGLPYPY